MQRKLLGKNTFETEEAIREALADDQVRSCTIGPSGENLVRFATVPNDGRQAGRTGHGMVWGSKKLKALSVRGTKGIKVADPATLMKMSFDISDQAQGPHTVKYRVLGTVTNVLNMNKLGLLPTRNYQEGTFEYAEQISGEELSEHYKVKTVACAQCPIACEQMSLVREGPYAGAITGIEYESLYATGSNCGISDMKAIIKMVDVCDESGMDSMSGGVTVSWVMETFEKRSIKRKTSSVKSTRKDLSPSLGMAKPELPPGDDPRPGRDRKPSCRRDQDRRRNH